MTSLQYPIGLYEPVETQTKEQLEAWIDQLAAIPQRYEEVTAQLADAQLDTPYRPGGWTVRQLIHHVADSHLNAYLRFKLALTEVTPHIRPYDQEGFASLPDSKAPISLSLSLISSLHRRWVTLLRGMTEEDFSDAYYHPADQQTVSLYDATGMYVWHSQHHLAHVTELIKRNQWN
ncbi:MULTISPECIES: YfiT family bacillithiol transferase [Bacillus]|uniref:YfiT family bacillithiol transferase n=1 Tax=Bacillus TaxID=1386 RepID=UPI002112FA93|nr:MULTISPECIES: bacillithiol transferase BstA [Bacillus]MED1749834.1 bacillithiol transferase BstA [Bacillus zhangzhouensis]UUD43474.1 bacillithiol transferase BstA [Bacillus pumilus]